MGNQSRDRRGASHIANGRSDLCSRRALAADAPHLPKLYPAGTMADRQPLDNASPRDHNRVFPKGCMIVVACLGVIPLLLGSAWLYTFIFTDFRPHHRPFMIPTGIVAVTIGGAMIALPFLLRRRR